MPIKAMVFDLDGLLVDSEPLAKLAWTAVLARYGRTLDAATINAMYGLRLRESASLVQQRFSLPVPAEQVAEEKHQILVELLDQHLRAMPGAAELLREVDRRGLRRAVATSSASRYAPAALRAVNLDGGFAAIVTGDMVPRGKPAPDIYREAAAALDLPPAACLALEDSPNGVEAARSAGMRCVAVPNELTADLDMSAADWVFPSLHAVAEQLDDLLAAADLTAGGAAPTVVSL